MCILFLHTNPEPKVGEYRLIVATNRDEHYKRPAAPASVDRESGIIAGKDLEPGREGGTWLGFAVKNYPEDGKKKFCFSALTNITAATNPNAKGRGFLVLNYLKSPKNFPDYITDAETGSNYNGYNLIAAELNSDKTCIYHHGNIPQVDSVYAGRQTLGFGNTPMFSPLKKVTEGRHKFQKIIDGTLKHDELIVELLNLLKDKTRHLPDTELKSREPSAVDFLSSTYVEFKDAGYGTRTHTIILIDHDWNAEFIEHTLDQPIDIENPKWIVNKFNTKL